MKTNALKTQKRNLGVFVVLLLAAFLLQQNPLFAQTQESNSNQSQINKPQINIKVKKKRDKNGNLIGYDSTYTYSYSSDGSNPQADQRADSVFKQMSQGFNGFGNMDAFPKSFANSDFFNDPFFQNFGTEMRMTMPSFEKMDSLMDHFMSRQFPQQMQAPKTQQNAPKQNIAPQKAQPEQNKQEYFQTQKAKTYKL